MAGATLWADVACGGPVTPLFAYVFATSLHKARYISAV